MNDSFLSSQYADARFRCGEQYPGDAAVGACKIVHVHPWSDMILFSELALHGRAIGFATEDTESIEAPFREFAAKHWVAACPGSYFLKSGKDIFNHTVGSNQASNKGDVLSNSNVATNVSIFPGHSMRRLAVMLLNYCICLI